MKKKSVIISLAVIGAFLVSLSAAASPPMGGCFFHRFAPDMIKGRIEKKIAALNLTEEQQAKVDEIKKRIKGDMTAGLAEKSRRLDILKEKLSVENPDVAAIGESVKAFIKEKAPQKADRIAAYAVEFYTILDPGQKDMVTQGIREKIDHFKDRMDRFSKGRWGRHKGRFIERHVNRVARELDLTDAQVARIKEKIEARRASMAERREEGRQLLEALDGHLNAAEPDVEAITALIKGAINKKIDAVPEKVDTVVEFYNSLSPEQKKKAVAKALEKLEKIQDRIEKIQDQMNNL